MHAIGYVIAALVAFHATGHEFHHNAEVRTSQKASLLFLITSHITLMTAVVAQERPETAERADHNA